MISEMSTKPAKKRSRTSAAAKNDTNNGGNSNVNHDLLKLHQCGNCVFCKMPRCDRCAGCVGLNGEGRGGSADDTKEDVGCCLRKVSR